MSHERSETSRISSWLAGGDGIDAVSSSFPAALFRSLAGERLRSGVALLYFAIAAWAAAPGVTIDVTGFFSAFGLAAVVVAVRRVRHDLTHRTG